MNYKSNKIFMKSCAVILAVSNIFSRGVSAAPKEKIKSSSISLTPKELAGSIFGTAGLSIFATLFLSKMFSAQSTPAVAKKDNNSANSSNSNETNRSSNSSDPSSINQPNNPLSTAPYRVDTEDDRQTADSIILALNETDNMRHSGIHNSITKRDILEQLRLRSDSAFLNYLATGQKRVRLSNDAVYEYCIAPTENPSCISRQTGHLGVKLQSCLNYLTENCNADNVFVMQLVNMTGHVMHSKCTVFNASAYANSNTSFDSIRCMDARNGILTLSTYSDPTSFPLCSGRSSSMLLTVGCWKLVSIPEQMKPEPVSEGSEEPPLFAGIP